MNNIPVLLVAAGDNLKSIHKVITSLNYWNGFKIFYIVCPSKNVVHLKNDLSIKFKLIDIKINVVNEEIILSGLNYKEIKKLLISKNFLVPNIVGWYLQQFLKMSFCKYIESEFYLIWDADTLMCKRNSFFDNCNRVLLTQGNEYNNSYFSYIKRLLPDVNIHNKSHISQHLLVKTKHMKYLLNSISSNNLWFHKAISVLNSESPFQFSEYELYSNFVLHNYPSEYTSCKKKWFRYGYSLTKKSLVEVNMLDLPKNIDFIAFECWDKPTFLRTLKTKLFFYLIKGYK